MTGASGQAVQLEVVSRADVSLASQSVRRLAEACGLDEHGCAEIALVVTELATNLVKHAGGGMLGARRVKLENAESLEIETRDSGPGIDDPEQAMVDGFSTSGGLGLGLGTVDRLVDRMHITSPLVAGGGTHIVCRIQLPSPSPAARVSQLPVDIGLATRPAIGQTENGDAYVLARWGHSALVGVLDGLGHGPSAHQAAETARLYIERHCEYALEDLFHGVDRACRSTRGVVMALAHIDFGSERVRIGSVGNVEIRLATGASRARVVPRRGVLGLNAPRPHVTQHTWSTSRLVLHSDGVSTRWDWDAILEQDSANSAARKLLSSCGKFDDDATVVVVRSTGKGGAN